MKGLPLGLILAEDSNFISHMVQMKVPDGRLGR